MKQRISNSIKKEVAKRAAHRCEYCRIPERYAQYSFHCEHIIGLQHGGSSHSENLAYACSVCNWKKGPNLATILEENGPLIRLFHPRKDDWFDHFMVEDGVIYPKTEIGAATVKLLELNAVDNIIERRALARLGLFP